MIIRVLLLVQKQDPGLSALQQKKAALKKSFNEAYDGTVPASGKKASDKDEQPMNFYDQLKLEMKDRQVRDAATECEPYAPNIFLIAHRETGGPMCFCGRRVGKG